MRFVLLVCTALFFSTGVFAQKSGASSKAKKVKNFSIEMKVAAGMTSTKYIYTIDKKGNGLYIHTMRDTVKSRIEFKLDKKQMADLQKNVIGKAGAYEIPDKVNCDYCADGIDITIKVSSSRGTKTIKGNNPQRVNENVNTIYKLIKSLVQEKRD